MNPNSLKVLVLFYSRYGSTLNLAHQIARGIESAFGCEAVVRTVSGISTVCEAVEENVSDSGMSYVTTEGLKTCFDLALGGPSHFGNTAATMKYFTDDTIPQWLGIEPAGRPATVFTSTGDLYSGQESILLTMMLPSPHRDMTTSGIPSSEHALNHTQSDDTPYDASHVAGHDGKVAFTPDEHEIVFAQGKWLMELAVKLAG